MARRSPTRMTDEPNSRTAATAPSTTITKAPKSKVTAKKKKYLMLRDADKRPLAPAGNAVGDVGLYLKKGAAWTWWAKFPAPPEDVKKIEYTWPIGTPIDNIPCTDA